MVIRKFAWLFISFLLVFPPGIRAEAKNLVIALVRAQTMGPQKKTAWGKTKIMIDKNAGIYFQDFQKLLSLNLKEDNVRFLDQQNVPFPSAQKISITLRFSPQEKSSEKRWIAADSAHSSQWVTTRKTKEPERAQTAQARRATRPVILPAPEEPTPIPLHFQVMTRPMTARDLLVSLFFPHHKLTFLLHEGNGVVVGGIRENSQNKVFLFLEVK